MAHLQFAAPSRGVKLPALPKGEFTMAIQGAPTIKVKTWAILLVPVFFMLLSCAAPQRVLVVANESDLQRGLTIQQVERILGQP